MDKRRIDDATINFILISSTNTNPVYRHKGFFPFSDQKRQFVVHKSTPDKKLAKNFLAYFVEYSNLDYYFVKKIANIHIY
jgi:hypothetical protein